MGKSFYEKEQEKIKALIKVPLLELVLQFLPHLQPSPRERDDTWEVVAIQLGQQQFTGALDDKKSIEELDSMPELNGFYIREVYEELYDTFRKSIQFRNAVEAPPMPIDGRTTVDSLHARAFLFNPKDRPEALLYTLYQMRHLDIEIMANVSRENLETSIRNHLKQQQLSDDVDHIPPTRELVQQYKKSAELKRNEILKQEINKKDKRLEQLTQENKRLLELNHDLLSQGGQGFPT
ncbi:hypothetical protein JA1_001405 [Spathaspora sp. JA1]|nr:hypothetical protein JA1_001405 [Spathaspora sp. JA1]